MCGKTPSEPDPTERGSPLQEVGCRLARHGPESLSDAELVGLLLQHRSDRGQALDLLNEVGSITALLGLDLPSLCHHGLSVAQARRLLLVSELARRQARQKLTGRWMHRPEDVARYLFLQFGKNDQEVMGALFVDMRNALIGEAEIFRGTMRLARVDPRVILRHALVRHAAGLLLFHTHPGGAPEPSEKDLRFTLTMAEACELLEVRLMDHLILGTEGTWVSLKQLGHSHLR